MSMAWRIICIALLVVLVSSTQTHAVDNPCESPVTVGPVPGNYCDGVACDYGSWTTAADDCAGHYTYDLEIQLYPNAESLPLYIPGTYSFDSGKRLIIRAVGGTYTPDGSALWDDNTFRCVLGPTDSAYAISITMPTTDTKVLLENLQFKRTYTNSTPDRWVDMLVALGTGDITLRNSFLWMYVPDDVTFGGRGKALYLAAGDKTIENVVIYGDKRTSSQYYGFLNFAAYIGNYDRDVTMTNLTVYGRGSSKGFVTGLYAYGGDVTIDNSYIRVKSSSCTPYADSGDYNIASCSSVIGANSTTGYSTAGIDDFVNPEPTGSSNPDFHLKEDSSLIDASPTLLDTDIGGDPRSETYSDTGAAEYQSE